MSKQVVLTEKQYCDLKRRSDLCGALLAAGVENWSGYAIAARMQVKTSSLKDQYKAQMSEVFTASFGAAIDSAASKALDKMVHTAGPRRLDSNGKQILFDMIVKFPHRTGEVSGRVVGFNNLTRVQIRTVDGDLMEAASTDCTIIGEHK